VIYSPFSIPWSIYSFLSTDEMDSGKHLLQLSAVERRDYDNAEAIGHRVNFWYKSYKTFYGRNLQM
jgi:hypothetical protein